MILTDRKAVQLSELLKDYFVDCVHEDPTSTHPGNLSVRELLEDLECSVEGPDGLTILENLNDILDLFV